MSPELQNKLKKRHPELLKAMPWSLPENAGLLTRLWYRWFRKPLSDEEYGQLLQRTLIVFGCECQDGWFDLIDETLDKLSDYYATLDNAGGYPPGEEPTCVQIKEKFGTLRIYLSHEDEVTCSIVDKAEQRSATICEWCGSTPARTTIDKYYWVRTLCGLCLEKSHDGYRPWNHKK